MTRGEAIKAVVRALEKSTAFKHVLPVIRAVSAEAEVDALAALGVLKLDVSLSERLATLGPEAFSVRNVADFMGEQRASDWRKPARCEPPPEHHDYRYHWLRTGPYGGLIVREWRIDHWCSGDGVISTVTYSPEEYAKLRWRYVAPCLPPEEKP